MIAHKRSPRSLTLSSALRTSRRKYDPTAIGPGNVPPPPAYSSLDGCDSDQIYSVCSCYFNTATSSTSSATPSSAPSSSANAVQATSTAAATTVVTSSTPSEPTGAATSGSATTLNPQSPSPCPYADHSNVTTSAGKTYEIYCGWDILYQDDPATYAPTMQDCLNACDAFVPNPPSDSYDQPCISVTFTGLYPTDNNCYLHFSTTCQQVSTSPYYDSAILVSSNSGSGEE
ncbi:MAG: hypothetical protein LQ340_004162 [Diploschistes diacapsis]|nr:MAG: hypothetical protein LQ340_004162 [Diploschistes diacapsis]